MLMGVNLEILYVETTRQGCKKKHGSFNIVRPSQKIYVYNSGKGDVERCNLCDSLYIQ